MDTSDNYIISTGHYSHISRKSTLVLSMFVCNVCLAMYHFNTCKKDCLLKELVLIQCGIMGFSAENYGPPLALVIEHSTHVTSCRANLLQQKKVFI